jgi:hypothetical protein
MTIMDDARAAPPAHRPYYIPASVDYGALPEAIKVAFTAIIEPAYRELVLGATGALARSAGVSLHFLLCLEVLDQFSIGHTLDFTGGPSDSGSVDRDRLIARHLRLLGSKNQAANFVLRLEAVRRGQDPAASGGQI